MPVRITMPRLNPNEFRQNTINTLTKRAGQRCSNPDCEKATSGGHSDATKAIIIGEAAHIQGQKLTKSARYNPNMTPVQRRSIENGIWLCRGCHKIVDTDPTKYPVSLLLKWKKDRESNALKNSGEKIDEVSKDVKEIRKLLESLGVKPSDSQVVSTDVFSNENIKKSFELWGKGNLEGAYNAAMDAYYESTGDVKLQAILNLIMLSGDLGVKKPGFFISLSNEGIDLAGQSKNLASVGVLKAHKAYFLQHKVFDNYLKVHGELRMRNETIFSALTDAQLVALTAALKEDGGKITTLAVESQKDAIESKSYSAVAHVKLTVGNTMGLSYLLVKLAKGDTGEVEHFTIKTLLEAKDIYEHIGDEEGVANVLHNLANNLRFFGDIEGARKYAKQAIIIAKKIGYQELINKGTELLEDRLKEGGK